MRLTALVFGTAVLAAGCSTDLEGGDAVGTNNEPLMTWEEFLGSVYQEPEELGGNYICNGDELCAVNLKQLEEYYELNFGPNRGALIINRSGGGDDKWSDTQKLNLTYCISNSFGSNKATLVAAFQQATDSGWEQAANLNFVYVPSQDANCTASNSNVVFDVRPTSGANYLARAFFPAQGRSSRNVIVDTSSFGNVGWPLSNIIGHELGHALGFRHEHTRPEAATCFEDNNWRALTPYDSASIMHYPQCNGSSSELSFTTRDFQGAAAVYGPPGTTPDPDPDPDPTPDPDPEPDPTPDGTPQSGSASGTVARRQQVQYQPIAVVPGSPMTVSMTGSGDPDLYVRFGAAPTVSSYSCRPYLVGAAETCSGNVPAGQTQMYIMVRGFTAASYTITANWVAP